MTSDRHRSRSGPNIPHADRAGVRVDLYLPAELARLVDARVAALGGTRSAVIRAAIVDALLGRACEVEG